MKTLMNNGLVPANHTKSARISLKKIKLIDVTKPVHINACIMLLLPPICFSYITHSNQSRQEDNESSGVEIEGHKENNPPIYSDSQLEFLIDPVLNSDDLDNDGMIDYAEFIAAQIKTIRGKRGTIEVSV